MRQYVLPAAWLAVVILPVLLADGCTDLDWPGFGQQSAQPESSAPLALGVEQNRQPLTAEKHIIRLRKAPFQLRFYFDRLGSMFVQASDRPETLQAAARGVDARRLLSADGPVPEQFLNPQNALLLDDRGAYQNWGYFSPTMHKFDANGVREVPEKEGGGYICARTISNLAVDGEHIPIDQLPGNRLYLVFFRTEQTPSGQVERQRDWLILEFVD